MRTNTELYKFASQFIDYGGSLFRQYCGLGSRDPYCNAYVTYVEQKGDDGALYCDGRKETYCPHSIQWCYNNLAVIPIYLAMPMDIVYFDWERNGVPNHIGFARKRSSDQVLLTLEGNTSKLNDKGKVVASGVVACRARTVDYIQAVFRPHYPTKFTIGALKEDGEFDYNSIAMMQKVLGMTPTAILDKNTVKALQKFLGVSQDGAWGKGTTTALQKRLIKDGCLDKGEADGWCGKKTVVAFQKWINKQYKATEEKPSTKPQTAPKKESYKGAYPEINVTETVTYDTRKDILAKAKELCWAKGTKKSKYAYNGGNPLKVFTKALHSVYTASERSRWGVPSQKGASCDVVVGTIVRASGVDKHFPRGLSEQSPYKSSAFQKIVKKGGNPYEMSEVGDIIWYDYAGSGAHVCIRGDGVIYQGAYKSTYAHTDKAVKAQLNKKKLKVIIFRAKPKKVKQIRKCLQKGDDGTMVTRLQKYINWYFGDKVLAEDGRFGSETDKYVKKMQKKLGLTEDGKVGAATITAMKKVVK